MTEKQMEYNLETSYQRMLAHPEALQLERERFENEVVSNPGYFEFWAKRYVRHQDHLQSFLDWSWEQYERTLTPQWTKAWEDELPSNAEYWNWDDERM
jgi:hypothetical protein